MDASRAARSPDAIRDPDPARSSVWGRDVSIGQLGGGHSRPRSCGVECVADYTRDMTRFIVRSARPADAAGMARVHVEGWRQTYRGLMSDEVLDAPDFVDRRERFWNAALGDDPRFAHVVAAVAVVDDEVVGIAMAPPIARSTCSMSSPIITAPAPALRSWTRWLRHPWRTCSGWPTPIPARRPSTPSTASRRTAPCASTTVCGSCG